MIQSKTGLPDGTYDLRIGKSFSKSSKNRQDYHTLRYDFKPKSVSAEQEAYIATVKANDDVHIAFANDASDNLTMFKGSSKPIKDGKECLLIFDEERGEMLLEKVVSNLNVKQTRGVDDETEQVVRNQINKMRKDRKPNKRRRNSPSPEKSTPPTELASEKSSPIKTHDSSPQNSTPTKPIEPVTTDQLFAEMMSSSGSSSSSSSEDEEKGEIVDDSQEKSQQNESSSNNASPKEESTAKERPRKYSYNISDSDDDDSSSSSSVDEFAAELERQLKASLSPTTTTNEDDDMPDLFNNDQTTPSTSEKPPSNSSIHDRQKISSLIAHNNLVDDLDLSESDEDSD